MPEMLLFLKDFVLLDWKGNCVFCCLCEKKNTRDRNRSRT